MSPAGTKPNSPTSAWVQGHQHAGVERPSRSPAVAVFAVFVSMLCYRHSCRSLRCCLRPSRCWAEFEAVSHQQLYVLSILGCAGRATLASPELQDVLAHSIVPLLPVQALASLACTSSGMRKLIYELHEAWCTCAATLLPATHPPLHGQCRASVQRALQRHSAAVANVLAGRPAKASDLLVSQYELAVGSIRFSPNGQHIAVMELAPCSLTMYNADTGTKTCKVCVNSTGLQYDHGSISYGFVWAPDSSRLVLFEGEEQLERRPSVQFFEVVMPQACLTRTGKWHGDCSISDVVLSDTGSLAAIAAWWDDDPRPTAIVETATGGFLMQLPLNGPITTFLDAPPMWSSDGQWLATQSLIVDIAQRSYQTLPDCQAFPGSVAASPKFSTDSSLLAYSLSTNANEFGAIFVDPVRARARHVIEGHSFVGFSTRGDKALLEARPRDAPSELQVWHLPTMQPLCSIAKPHWWSGLCRDYSLVPLCFADRFICIEGRWDWTYPPTRPWADRCFRWLSGQKVSLSIYDCMSGAHLLQPLAVSFGSDVFAIWHPTETSLLLYSSMEDKLQLLKLV